MKCVYNSYIWIISPTNSHPASIEIQLERPSTPVFEPGEVPDQQVVQTEDAGEIEMDPPATQPLLDGIA